MLSRDKFHDWHDVQTEVVAVTRAFLSSTVGQGSFLASARAVTVGFDDGDLERVT